MSTTLFGHLNINDTDRIFARTDGQDLVVTAITDYFAAHEAALRAQLGVFVEGLTTDFRKRFKTPGTGYMTARGENSPTPAQKFVGQWDVDFPLFDYGDSIGGNDVDIAYMTAGELERQVLGVANRDVNTVRLLAMQALFRNTATTVTDPLHGSLSVQPLANGDGVLYPPLPGQTAPATDNHYLASGYVASGISNTNNPIPVMTEELLEHFGRATGGENVVTFIHPDQVPLISGLTGFVDQGDQFIRTGVNTAVPINLPNVPGRIIGRGFGSWVVEWRNMPTGYLLSTHLEVEKPLMQRVDPADTGLGQGLQLVGNDVRYPITHLSWRHRFGFGAANRLNGVVMQLTTGSYAIPSLT
jgi:hypothetical protein